MSGRGNATTQLQELVRAVRVATVRLASLGGPDLRLDAKHYQGEFVLARSRVEKCGQSVRPMSHIADAFVPSRMKLVTVGHPEAGVPYLRAHDAFTTRPESHRYVSAARTPNYDSYLLRKGTILTPSSGRNLGPLAYVGSYLANFAMTDIMRIRPKTREDGFFLLAFLSTPTGQALIRRGRTGTNVDHVAPGDVLAIPVVWPRKGVRGSIANEMRKSQDKLERSRQQLDALEVELHERAGLPVLPEPARYISGLEAKAFSMKRSDLALRLDAAFYDPAALSCRRAVEDTGARPLADMAHLILLGRYKRYYVDPQHGHPILSGRQILQLRPVNLQWISDRSFDNPDAFLLRRGMSLLTCDGRAEEALASPAYVSSLWNGWMASNHVMRAEPKNGVHPGYLYLALRSPYVQRQLKTRATGSVVDALDPDIVGDVLLPVLDRRTESQLAKKAEDAWEHIADSFRIADRAVARMESLIVRGYERAA